MKRKNTRDDVRDSDVKEGDECGKGEKRRKKIIVTRSKRLPFVGLTNFLGCISYFPSLIFLVLSCSYNSRISRLTKKKGSLGKNILHYIIPRVFYFLF